MHGVELEFDDPLAALPPGVRKQFSALIDKFPLATVHVDCNGTVTHASGRGLGRLNLSPHDLIGQSILDLTHDLPHVLDDVSQSLLGKQTLLIDDVCFSHLRLPCLLLHFF